LVALIAGALTIALSPIFVRAVLGEVGPTAAAFWRTALAIPPLWLWLAMEPADDRSAARRPTGWHDYATLCAVSFFFAGDLILWHLSIKYTSIANSTLLANFAPIYVAALSFLLFGERFNRVFVAGLVLAIVGAAILMGDSLSVGTDHLVGDGLGLVTGMFYGCYILIVGRLRARFTAATIMTWTAIGTSLFILPVALLSGEPMIPGTLFGWSMLFGLAVVTQFGGQGLIAFALAHLPASFSSVSLLIQPVAAAVLAWAIFAEPLGATQVVGGAVVLTGIMLARRGSRPSSSTAEGG
jgi:drug/metabolite transporter (DMT)-like permease